MLALGLQARAEGGHPPAFQSGLLICGLALLAGALLTLADVLGAGFDRFPGRRDRVDVAGAGRGRAVAGGGEGVCDLRADRSGRRRHRCAVVRELGDPRELGDDLPLAAGRRRARLRRRLAAAARVRAAALRADGQRGGPGRAGDRPHRRGERADRPARPVRKRRRRAAPQRLGARRARRGLRAGGLRRGRPGARRHLPGCRQPRRVRGLGDDLPARDAALLAAADPAARPRRDVHRPAAAAPAAAGAERLPTGSDVPLASRTDEEAVLRVRDDSPPRP